MCASELKDTAMRTYEHTLEGVYEHKLDPKCRVSVPSDWRVSAGSGTLRLLRSTKYEKPILKVLTDQEFASLLAQVDERTEWSHAQRQLMRGRLFSDSQKTKLNPQGKLPIPKALCEMVGLEPDGPASLVGRGTYFEIVKPDYYHEMRVREDEEIAKLNADMGIF
ncbi:MraZ protein [Rubritalea squalenifaciens DSM 18772]|uniref:MraZ protein n=3 Tax=Rubritaleaceae TaxID=1648490 RepID=A0A1M6PDV4_9BACT|nr:MraZ protein [Rubritalea squalenifaciens DSM 18772]